MNNSSQLKKLTDLTNEKSKDVLATILAITDEFSFVESDKFVLSQTSLGDAVGEGVVSGFAQICDIQTGIFATNPAVLKGSIGKQNAAKITKLIDNAVATDSPIVGIFDTSGARFNEGIEALEGYSAIIKAFSKAYSVVPTVCVVKGNNFGLLSYLSSVCDICVAYDKAVIATSSPLIIASKTNIDAAKVGTTAVHTLAGLISKTVKNDAELKDVLSTFFNFVFQPSADCEDDGNRALSLKTASKLLDVVSKTVDKGSLMELKKSCAPEAVTALARLNGITTAIIGVEGKLSALGAVKMSEFLITCESFNIPVVSFVDCEGAENNLTAENGCLIREIGNLLYTLNQLTVAKISVITGNAVGLGYTAFASKSIYDYTIAWSNASINAVTDTAAANLLYATEIAAAKDRAKAEQKLAESYAEENSNAVTVAQKGFIDNVIDAEYTRPYVIAALQTFISKR